MSDTCQQHHFFHGFCLPDSMDVVRNSLLSLRISPPGHLPFRKKHPPRSCIIFWVLGYIHPQKLTWNLEMMVSNRNHLFQGSIFRFHVVLGGVKLLFFSPRFADMTCFFCFSFVCFLLVMFLYRPISC